MSAWGLFCFILTVFTSRALCEPFSTSLIKSGPVQITEEHSSSVLNEIVPAWSLRSQLDCFIKCLSLGCALVSLSERDRLCQLVVLNDASRNPGPNGTHQRRLLGATASEQLWQTVDFAEQLRTKTMRFVFNKTGTGRNGSAQSFSVLTTDCFRLEAYGARGGATNPTDPVPSVVQGGRGAKMSVKFSLTNGTSLTMIVGQKGGDAVGQYRVTAGLGYLEFAGSGGGGGTFVYRSTDGGLLLAAGGGGGGSNRLQEGVPGQSSMNGTNTVTVAGNLEYLGFGGINGNPGFVNNVSAREYYKFGGAGAGWLGKSAVPPRTDADAESGGSRAENWIGGRAGTGNAAAVGGFGGGGDPCGGSGGGGGYSGGGAGRACEQGGGGGGSFCSGTGCEGTTGGNSASDDGYVVIQIVGPQC